MKIIALIALLLSTLAQAESDPLVPKIQVESGVQLLQESNKTFLAINYRNAPHWHTYWKNPGDAGLPMKAQFVINGTEEVLTEQEWPAPKKYLEEGDILAYGYEGEYSLFFNLPDNYGDGTKLSVTTTWLACRHICIPGQAIISGTIQNRQFVTDNTTNLTVTSDILSERLANLPTNAAFPSNLDLLLKKNDEGGDLILLYNLGGVAANLAMPVANLLTPFPHETVSFKHESLFTGEGDNIFGALPVDWDGQYQRPPIDLPTDGRFASTLSLKFLYANPLTQKFEVIEKSFTSFALEGSKRQKDFLALLKPIANHPKAKPGNTKAEATNLTDRKDPSEERGLLRYLLLALIGGLILNVMPCVLPIISLKLFGLVAIRDENPKRIRSHNLLYTAGVLATFLALGLAVIALKYSGQVVGWGFHMQSPIFVLAMSVVVFIMTLNLFGLFEFATPGSRSLGGVQLKESALGDFFGGVIATVLSTPCSAPFLGTALAFAFGADLVTILLVFFFIGIGLALPFIITAFFPSFIRFLPRPGKWMENVKKFLGLTLLLTLIWLIDVFTGLSDNSAQVMALHTALSLLFFAFYFKRHMSNSRFWQGIFFALPLCLLFYAGSSKQIPVTAGTTSSSETMRTYAGSQWSEWSEKQMRAEKGHWVFMNFTAKWCFTCKVNERLVLDTDSFRSILKQNNVKLLLGDWTKRDPVIGTWLSKQGMVGVPAYFLQAPDGTLHVLGETVSVAEVSKVINSQ
jgi:thiol:disulfide interchange protein DsbD